MLTIKKSAVKLAKISSYQWSKSLYQNLNKERLSEKIGLPLDCAGGFYSAGRSLKAPRQFVPKYFLLLTTTWIRDQTSQKIIALNYEIYNGF